MESRVAVDQSVTSDAAEFVRFCHRRRRVGWPELYDEMWQTANRRAFRGLGPAELSQIGVGFSLYETPALAQLVLRVLEADGERARPSQLLPRRTALRDATDDAPAERHRTLVRALGVA